MSALSFLIAIAPLLLLLGSLALRRYPGEAAIERLRGIIEAAVRPAVVAEVDGRGFQLTRDDTARGGDLIARSLAGRAPPVPA